MMRRRDFVFGSGAMLALPACAVSRSRVSPASLAANPFSLGVASGDPTASAISLWTRLAPRPLEDGGMPMQPATVTWELSDRKDFASVVRRGEITAWPEYGHNCKLRVGQLNAGREYYYRFRFGRFVSRIGRFRTAPAADDARPVRIAVVSCNRYEDGWFHAFRHIIEDDVDLVIHTGDYIYEKAPRTDRMRSHAGRACVSLAEYRRRYAQYRLDPDLQDLHARVPFVTTWDDHEVSGNWAGDDSKFDVPKAVFAMRRAAAFQAYWEAMPFDVPAYRPGQPLQLYRGFGYGPNAELVVLDTRQYRDDQACGDKPPKPLCEAARRPGHTMLGPDQGRWLEARLRGNRQAWPLVVHGVPPFELDYAPGAEQVVSMDKWDGYPAAQARLNSLLAASATPPLTLAGDAHAHFAAVRRDPETGSVHGADLVATSVSSGGDGSDADSHWPIWQRENPDLLYHSKRRGYVLLDVGKAGIDVQFRTLDRITTRAHSLYRDATARLERAGEFQLTSQRTRLRQVKAGG